ncbi:unnamed protein product [Lasius platythorax]|uniref:Uncharacterized protein n=1 Tax=Lasius platythorax TaxID=488582 RepID=A0AAV2N599_9HYME
MKSRISKDKILQKNKFAKASAFTTKRVAKHLRCSSRKGKRHWEAAEKKERRRKRKTRVARYPEITRDETFIKHTAHDSFVDFQQSAPGSGRI